MPVSDQSVMSAMQGAPASSPTSATETPPMGAPMSTPEPKQGNREAALVNLGMALDLMEQAIPGLSSESPDGQKVMGAIRSLTGILGPRKGKTGELQNSEIMGLMQNLPQGQGAPPSGSPPGGAPPSPTPPMPGGQPPM